MRLSILSALVVLGAISEPPALALRNAFSQATQGWAWQGTVAVRKEAMTVTVHADHLDVEVEWDLVTGKHDWQGWPNFPEALEILGTIDLEPGASVVGLITWYKGDILKGKLKHRLVARAQYEEVVDRNVTSPPPPRDPVLLEELPTGRGYRLSIFPVKFGDSRRIRFRYLVPFQSRFRSIPVTASPLASLTVRTGADVDSVTLRSATRLVTVSGASTFDNRDMCVNGAPSACPTGRDGLLQGLTVHPRPVPGGSHIRVGAFAGKGLSGHMIHSVLKVPPSLLEALPRSGGNARVFVTLRSGGDTCEIAIPRTEDYRTGSFSHRAFAKSMPDATLHWKLDLDGSWAAEAFEKAVIVPAGDGLHYARSFGKIPFYPMASTMPRSLGAALGFIDTAYALVALEEDALPGDLRDRYQASGVPTLDPGDIFPSRGGADAVDVKAWLRQNKWDLADLRRATAIKAQGDLPAGIRFLAESGVLRVFVDAALASGDAGFRLSLHDLSGREVKAWSRREAAAGMVAWAPAGSRPAGAYLLRVVLAGRSHTAVVRFP